jgi:hypothetical protein
MRWKALLFRWKCTFCIATILYRIELLLEEHVYEQAQKVLDQILYESDEAFRHKYDEILREFEHLIRQG